MQFIKLSSKWYNVGRFENILIWANINVCFSLSTVILVLRRNRTPPLCDILPFEINTGNDYSILLYFLFVPIWHLLWSSVKSKTSNLWAVRLNHAPVLLFISLVEFYKCIFEANVIDFEIFKTIAVIIFGSPVIFQNIARCPIPP